MQGTFLDEIMNYIKHSPFILPVLFLIALAVFILARQYIYQDHAIKRKRSDERTLADKPLPTFALATGLFIIILIAIIIYFLIKFFNLG